MLGGARLALRRGGSTGVRDRVRRTAWEARGRARRARVRVGLGLGWPQHPGSRCSVLLWQPTTPGAAKARARWSTGARGHGRVRGRGCASVGAGTGRSSSVQHAERTCRGTDDDEDATNYSPLIYEGATWTGGRKRKTQMFDVVVAKVVRRLQIDRNPSIHLSICLHTMVHLSSP